MALICLVHISIPSWTVLILDSVSYLMLKSLGCSSPNLAGNFCYPVKWAEKVHENENKTVCRVELFTPVNGHGAKPCNSSTLITPGPTRLAQRMETHLQSPLFNSGPVFFLSTESPLKENTGT